MNYGQIRQFDVANGPGIRTSVFVTGCTLNCKGCFNQNYQNFQSGKPWTKQTENLTINFLQNNHVCGLSVLGGEPLLQDENLLKLLQRAKKETKKSIWLWTGFLFEQLTRQQMKILNYIDVLVDGPFEENKKNLKLKFRGSENQRIINISQTLKTNKITLLKEFY